MRSRVANLPKLDKQPPNFLKLLPPAASLGLLDRDSMPLAKTAMQPQTDLSDIAKYLVSDVKSLP